MGGQLEDSIFKQSIVGSQLHENSMGIIENSMSRNGINVSKATHGMKLLEDLPVDMSLKQSINQSSTINLEAHN